VGAFFLASGCSRGPVNLVLLANFNVASRDPHEEMAKWRCLVEALRIADKRNTVAHNPMQAQVYRHSETGRFFIESAITSSTTNDYIDDLELIELRAAAEDIVTRLYMALGFISPETKVG
jgi:hypothetical protein